MYIYIYIYILKVFTGLLQIKFTKGLNFYKVKTTEILEIRYPSTRGEIFYRQITVNMKWRLQKFYKLSIQLLSYLHLFFHVSMLQLHRRIFPAFFITFFYLFLCRLSLFSFPICVRLQISFRWPIYSHNSEMSIFHL